MDQKINQRTDIGIYNQKLKKPEYLIVLAIHNSLNHFIQVPYNLLIRIAAQHRRLRGCQTKYIIEKIPCRKRNHDTE